VIKRAFTTLALTLGVGLSVVAAPGTAFADTGHASVSVADAQLQQEVQEDKQPCPPGTLGGPVYGYTTGQPCRPYQYTVGQGSGNRALASGGLTGILIIGAGIFLLGGL
jgi:hypothetical protein